MNEDKTIFQHKNGSYDVGPFLHLVTTETEACDLIEDIEYVLERFFTYFCVSSDAPNLKDANVFNSLMLLKQAIAKGEVKQ